MSTPTATSSSSAFYSVSLQKFRRGEGERMLPIDIFFLGEKKGVAETAAMLIEW